MNVPFRKSDLARATAMAASLAIGLGAFTSEADGVYAGSDDQPDSAGGSLSNDLTL